MGGQAEIVVRRQIDHRFAVERGARRLLTLEDAKLAVEALLFEGFELVGEVAQGVGAHGVRV
jgi:hypothetical protein